MAGVGSRLFARGLLPKALVEWPLPKAITSAQGHDAQLWRCFRVLLRVFRGWSLVGSLGEWI